MSIDGQESVVITGAEGLKLPEGRKMTELDIRQSDRVESLLKYTDEFWVKGVVDGKGREMFFSKGFELEKMWFLMVAKREGEEGEEYRMFGVLRDPSSPCGMFEDGLALALDWTEVVDKVFEVKFGGPDETKNGVINEKINTTVSPVSSNLEGIGTIERPEFLVMNLNNQYQTDSVFENFEYMRNMRETKKGFIVPVSYGLERWKKNED